MYLVTGNLEGGESTEAGVVWKVFAEDWDLTGFEDRAGQSYMEIGREVSGGTPLRGQ